jgi:cyclopropane-fatty-acyl-phospholipid synthase
VGITISHQQYEYAKHFCKGLPVDIRFQDYRDVNETFDRIVSLGMFEHVGHKNYSTYMQTVHDNLNDDGIFLLHTIGDNITEVPNQWITKYIFPHGILPSIKLIGASIENLFTMEDWHNFGADYDKTLMAWHHRFSAHWNELKLHYDERFKRMWNYYLLSCAGGFRSRGMQLWQIVLSKKGIKGGYRAPR